MAGSGEVRKVFLMRHGLENPIALTLTEVCFARPQIKVLGLPVSSVSLQASEVFAKL